MPSDPEADERWREIEVQGAALAAKVGLVGPPGVTRCLDDQLAELSRLEDGWDSYGGKPISAPAIDRCRRLTFVPTSDGGVQIELSSRDVWSEIEITPQGDIGHVHWGAQ